ncbi:hypothetical protein ACOGYQ_001936 [Edwardsiella piscicida]|uniref:hypothetical protein n=1 Tax=Edwardsiella piscicida TaxID=1263550 RepID=UPI000900C2FD|nr:hypothetical protein [Edwardsiella piscicida]EKS7766927.1 hypothetical protein [Edwardsiella piscicida]QBB12129.1 hypothetical protein EVK84_05960 [Edwardsiella piscicida]UBU79959.1 hypothetical protein A9797_17620 [Edwardsiella piscicida]UCQ31538.1 hypothetical protein DCF74_01350 [Edwardsiella piscicida]
MIWPTGATFVKLGLPIFRLFDVSMSLSLTSISDGVVFAQNTFDKKENIFNKLIRDTLPCSLRRTFAAIAVPWSTRRRIMSRLISAMFGIVRGEFSPSPLTDVFA